MTNVLFGVTCRSCENLITWLGNVLERLCLLRLFWLSLVGRRSSEEDVVKFFIFGQWKWGLSLKGSQHARQSSELQCLTETVITVQKAGGPSEGLHGSVGVLWGGGGRLGWSRSLSRTFAVDHGGVEVGVPAGVLDEVVAAHKALVAEWAHEAFLACVGTQVSGQLIGTGELLFAVGPGARKGPLT